MEPYMRLISYFGFESREDLKENFINSFWSTVQEIDTQLDILENANKSLKLPPVKKIQKRCLHQLQFQASLG